VNKTTLLLTTAIVAVGLSAPGFAAKTHPAATASAKFSHQVSPVYPKHGGGSKTVLSTNSFYGTVASGFSGTVDSQSVTAGKKGGVLAMSAFFQYCGFGGEYVDEATDVIALVDGTYVDGGPFQAALSSSEYCLGDSWQGIYTVAAGAHTVTWEGYSLDGDALLYRNTERTDVLPVPK